MDIPGTPERSVQVIESSEPPIIRVPKELPVFRLSPHLLSETSRPPFGEGNFFELGVKWMWRAAAVQRSPLRAESALSRRLLRNRDNAIV
jgi:hypothetical protein